MLKSIIAFAATCLATLPASADAIPGPVPAEVVRVVDGDTIKVRAFIWVDQTVRVSVRLRGIDTPELYRPKCENEKTLARQAKSAVLAYAPLGSTVQLTNITRDKYGGRVVAEVLVDDAESLGERLLAQGQAIAIGDEKPWCQPKTIDLAEQVSLDEAH